MSSVELSRELRKNQTKAEEVFWEKVRNRRFNGCKITRQHPIKFNYYDTKRFFIADFYCAKEKLVIEIDGKTHEKQKEYDEYRTYLLNNLGYRVIRFNNKEIFKNMPSVLIKLNKAFSNNALERVP